MSLSPFIYESKLNSNPNKALVVLPDIFGLNQLNKEMMDDFALQTGFTVFGLDYFYQKTGFVTDLGFDQASKAVEQMNSFTGEDFTEIFNKTLSQIFAKYPNVQEIDVCGFCFGGRLALLSALNEKINKVISFYGAGVHKPDFYKTKSVIQTLQENQNITQDQEFLLFFGEQDQSIPEIDRISTQDILSKQSKQYQQVIYKNAGHAFFNKGRASFVPEIYQKTVDTIKKFLI